MAFEVEGIIKAVATLAPLVKDIIKGLKGISSKKKLDQQAMKELTANMERMNKLDSNLREVGRLGRVLNRYMTFKSKVASVSARAQSFSKTFPKTVDPQSDAAKILMDSYIDLRHEYTTELKSYGTKMHFDAEDIKKIANHRKQINESIANAEAHKKTKAFSAIKDEVDEIGKQLDNMTAIANKQLDLIVGQIMELA